MFADVRNTLVEILLILSLAFLKRCCVVVVVVVIEWFVLTVLSLQVVLSRGKSSNLSNAGRPFDSVLNLCWTVC